MPWIAHLMLAGFVIGSLTSGAPADARSTASLPSFQDAVVVSAMAPPPGAFDGLVRSSLSAADLAVIGPDPSRHLEIARLSAGAFGGRIHQRVEGMSAAVAPGSEATGAVTVGVDPFSVEFGGLDQIHADISLRAPSRRWVWGGGPSALRWGRHDALTSPVAAHDSNHSGFVAGPLPWSRLTFVTQASRYTADRASAFVDEARAGVEPDAEGGITSSRQTTGAAVVTWTGEASQFRVSLMESRVRITNAGIGGITTPSAAFDIDRRTRQYQGSWRSSHGSFTQRGGVSYDHRALSSDAVALTAARVVVGVAAEGADMHRRREGVRTVSFRNVLESHSHRWLAGGEASRSAIVDEREFNPGGVTYWPATGTVPLTITTRGSGLARMTAASAAGFLQRVVFARPSTEVRAGLRAEWDRGEGWFLSPRVRAGTVRRGTVLYVAGALIPEQWPYEAGLDMAWRTQLTAVTVGDRPLSFDVRDTFRRRRDLMIRIGSARRIGPLAAGIEHTWTRGFALAGSTRAIAGERLIERADSDRRLARAQTHAMAQISRWGLSMIAHYERVSSRDDTDGWFSLPERQADPAAEWGRSAGVARHQASLVLTGRLPAAISVLLSARARSGSPFNVLTGIDAEGVGAFTDREGRERNSGTSAGSTGVNLYVSRQFAVPRLRTFKIEAGGRLENLFNRITALEVGQIAGTALFARPLSAGPGRALSLWATVARH